MPYKVTLAGQDITLYVQEETVDIESTIGGGPGTGSGSSGRAATASLISTLGPAATAIGAGQPIPNIGKNLFSANQSDVETNTSGFTANLGVSGGISRDTSTSWHGAASLKCIADGTGGFQDMAANLPASSFIPNQTYTLSVYAKASTGTPTLRMFFEGNNDATGNHAIGSTPNITLSTTWTRYSVTATMPAVLANPSSGVPYTTIGLRIDTGGTQAVTFWIDGLQLEQGSVATNWVVGTSGAQVGTPSLVRQGLLQIWDATSTLIYTGYVGKLTDETAPQDAQVTTKIECYDIWQDMDRVIVNEVYLNQTDIGMLRALFTKYAPQVDISLLPASGSFSFTQKLFREVSLQHAAQNLADTTGYQLWITPDFKLHYEPLSAASTAPFTVSDMGVNGTSVAGMWLDNEGFVQDDQALINRVFVYGGNKRSTDFTQVWDNQHTATNKTFIFAYYPRNSSNGKIQVIANGVQLVVGAANSSDKLISDGGTKDVLVDRDQKVAQFSSVPATPLSTIYQYDAPLVVQVTDATSLAFFGRYYDATVRDSTITDASVALTRGRSLLAQQSYGLTHLTFHTRQYGLQAGMLIGVNHHKRGIVGTFQIQKVTYEPQGAGLFYYKIECGAWKWNVVDVLMQLNRALFGSDTTQDESQDVITAQQLPQTVHMTLAWTSSQRAMGGYYARATPVGDGHDAYPGLSTI